MPRMARVAPTPVRLDFPGHEIVAAGLDDLAAGRQSEAALVVAMAAPRLRRLGLHVPPSPVDVPGHRLYDLLAQDGGGSAHSRYNALIGRVVSYARAAEHATAR